MLKAKVLLAPLSGCTDLAFRLICRELGAEFAFFEMVDCHSLLYGNVKRTDILKTVAADRPIAAQIVGPEPDKMLQAAKILLKIIRPAFLDINAACPVPKMLKKKAGAYLLKEPKTLAAIIAKLANNLDLPITVKLRTGFDHCDLKEIASIARSCEKSGAAALFIHGRTKGQGYSGEPDYRAVKEIKSAVDIPVYGSGSIFSKELADRMFKETGCDGVLVARGALGNPWIFKQLQGPFEVSLIERIRVLKKHLSYIDQYCEAKPRSKIGIMRKVALWYLKGFPNSARIRAKIGRAADQEHLLKIIDQEVGLP